MSPDPDPGPDLPGPDLIAARAFMSCHGRVLDRRRFALFERLSSDSEREQHNGVLAALDCYRNPDGGYGWGLEPDLRSAVSQPAAALHAFEAISEAGPSTTPSAATLCDWLATVTLEDGGLPFALPVPDPAGCAPFFLDADHHRSSLQITAAVTTQAHLVARHDPAVSAHPWLARATGFCFDAIEELATPHAYELSFALQFLDVLAAHSERATALLEVLAEQLPADGTVPVAGGAEDERLRPLDYSPWPDGPLRRFIADEVITGDLRRLASLQQDDGGWTVDFDSYSPAAALEWRGYATVKATQVLRAHAEWF